MDDLSASPSLTIRMKQIAHGFADRMGPKDVLSVTYLNGGSSVTTQIRAEVKAAIDRFKPIGSHGAMTPGSKEQHAIETIGALSAQLAARRSPPEGHRLHRARTNLQSGCRRRTDPRRTPPTRCETRRALTSPST